MKAIKNSLSVLMLVILVLLTSMVAQSQGRGNGNSHPGRGNNRENHPGKGHNKDNGNHHDRNDRRYDNDRYRNYSNDWHHRNFARDDHHRFVTYRHHRHSHPSWAPAYGYRYNTRYVYYQDYNVYYDCHRDVFMSWNGRNWMVSTRAPEFMLRVDFRSARVYGVDYWDDDFDFYLQRRRPSYVSISAAW